MDGGYSPEDEGGWQLALIGVRLYLNEASTNTNECAFTGRSDATSQCAYPGAQLN